MYFNRILEVKPPSFFVNMFQEGVCTEREVDV